MLRWWVTRAFSVRMRWVATQQLPAPLIHHIAVVKWADTVRRSSTGNVVVGKHMVFVQALSCSCTIYASVPQAMRQMLTCNSTSISLTCMKWRKPWLTVEWATCQVAQGDLRQGASSNHFVRAPRVGKYVEVLLPIQSMMCLLVTFT